MARGSWEYCQLIEEVVDTMSSIPCEGIYFFGGHSLDYWTHRANRLRSRYLLYLLCWQLFNGTVDERGEIPLIYIQINPTLTHPNRKQGYKSQVAQLPGPFSHHSLTSFSTLLPALDKLHTYSQPFPSIGQVPLRPIPVRSPSLVHFSTPWKTSDDIIRIAGRRRIM